MGKSLKELFQTKVLESGQTAAKQYDIRDSKDILITPGNSLLGLPFKAANVLRRRFGARLSESFFEEEATGLRIINKLSAPIIYGTDVFRLSTQSTDMVTTMKGGTGTTAGDRGIVGNLINKGKTAGLKLASKLGIAFPETMIPTKIALNQKFKSGKEPNTMVTLAEIKKDAAGTLVGKFLAKNATGTPKQILNGVIGGGIGLAKNAVRKKLFGGRTEGQQLYAKKSSSEIQYDSQAFYSTTVDKSNNDIVGRNDLSSILLARGTNTTSVEKPIGSTAGSSTNSINASNNPFAKLGDKVADIKKDNEKNLSQAKKVGQQEISAGKSVGDTKSGGTPTAADSVIRYSDTVDEASEDVALRNDLSSMLDKLNGLSTSNIQSNSNQLGKTAPEKPSTPSGAGTKPDGSFQTPKPDPTQLAKSRKQGQIEVGVKIKQAKDNPVLKYDPNIPTTAYSNTVDELADDVNLRNDLSTRLTQLVGTTSENSNANPASKPQITQNSKSQFPSTNNLGSVGKGGKDLFTNLVKDNVSPKGLPDSVSSVKKPRPSELIGGRKEGQQVLGKKQQISAESDPILKNDPNIPSTAYSNTVDETTTDINTRNDLSSVLAATQAGAGVSKPDPKNVIGIRNKGIPITQEIRAYSNLRSRGNDSELAKILTKTQTNPASNPRVSAELNQVGAGNGGVPTKEDTDKFKFPKKDQESKNGTSSNNGDYINKQKPGVKKDASGKDIQSYDFIPLVIASLTNAENSVMFRGTITGLTETFSPSWDSQRFIGSPFSYYIYQSVERNVTFNFRVWSQNPEEHIAAWDKLGVLAKMVYPQGYPANGAVTPPLVSLTLGDLYKTKESFIESLSYTIDDNSPWEIGTDVSGYKAPKVIDVAITFKFLQSKGSTSSMYGFSGGVSENGKGGVGKSTQTGKNGSKSLDKTDKKKQTQSANPKGKTIKPEKAKAKAK
jgi:hypothetical protein